MDLIRETKMKKYFKLSHPQQRILMTDILFKESPISNIGGYVCFHGDIDIDKERLRYAARVANINDFIDKNPLGYNMKIGMEGTGISQGQRQRVLIARATYKNPNIFLFDEATNALDSKNETEIMKNLSECFNGKTVVIEHH